MTIRRPFLSALGATVLLAACQSVPYTGRSHLVLVSQAQERKLGEEAYKEALTKGKVSTDPEKTGMIRRIGHRISKAANRPDFQWEFNVIEDEKQINAWCLPGGKVAFYTAIFPVTATEPGAAVVMGHEVAHALARHGAERMSQGMVAQAGAQAASIFLGGSSAATKQVFDQAFGLGANHGLLAYSRHQESEADHIGLILMAQAGYDPHEAVEFWGRMEKATGGGKGGNNPLAKYLGTHPPSKERQEQIRQWLPEAMQHYKPEAKP
ncbi:MAG: M48 family metallopeptidase [Elusimicrobia bacterium]|nr:M48 family metallopeptidase [Elusimicrobiota bacterium]